MKKGWSILDMPKKPNVLALIGMSNIGKSHWAKRLSQVGYLRHTVDDMIAAKFSDQNISDVNHLAKWLGQPWSEGYSEREEVYLDLENQCVLEAIELAQAAGPEENVVIDTTGSMFYTPQSTIDKLTDTAKIVYLMAPQHLQRRMLQKYIDEPKPVIWGSLFNQKSSETRGQALARCYLELLNWRTKTYEKYAEVTIDYDERFQKNYTTQDFLRQIGHHG